MAASVQAVASGLRFVSPAGQHASSNSSSQSSAARHAVAGPWKSQFLGVSHVFGSLRSSKPASPVTARSNAIVCASFFEKLGKLFSDDQQDQEQVMGVYEFNELDRGSPFFVKNSKGAMPAVGDFVPYSNKVYDCTGKRYLGISSGLCTVVEHNAERGGDRYETTMSHYLGDYGHISCQGPYTTYTDTEMAVTGGTGIFAGVRGWVKCHNVKTPVKLLYTYHIKGIAKLPAELTKTPTPLEGEKPAANNTIPLQKVQA